MEQKGVFIYKYIYIIPNMILVLKINMCIMIYNQK